MGTCDLAIFKIVEMLKLNELKKSLQLWDGKHIDQLSKIYQDHIDTPEFFESVIAYYLTESDLQKATSWLIKHHYDNRKKLSNEQEKQILRHANQLIDWESKLHILQLIPKFQIDQTLAEDIEPFVQNALYADQKFVRAAAYEAYYHIVKHFPVLCPAFKAKCALAIEQESASIKVKIRKILPLLQHLCS